MKRISLAVALALCALFLAAGSAAAASPCAQMKSWLKEGGGAFSGLMVIDAESGETLCASGATRQLPLASNTKLFTTSAVLAKLGPTTRVPTKVFAQGPIEGGVLHGSLYLQGGGDPVLGTPAFYNGYLAGLGTNIYALAPQIAAAGITRVTGRLFADDTIFDRKRGVADSGYATSSYIGPLSGLDFNSGFAGSTSTSGFSTDPAKLAAATLDRSLISAGVQISPTVALAKTPAGAQRVGLIRSPQMTEIVNTTDVASDNFLAEMLIKLLGARFGGLGTTANGARVVEEFARSVGSGIHSVDGSGLTRTNHASADQVAHLLLGLRSEPFYEEFVQDLALAGKEGTVADRMKGTAAYGRCRTKTGTLTGVSNLSGYCFNTSGKQMIFSVLMGSVADIGLAHLDQDRIAGAVAGY
jgi:D-alanyl-D-alanine carboxypeptidase/D-alanyl-D-alanine-endopeptidase (penicillin-binding protein 4)